MRKIALIICLSMIFGGLTSQSFAVKSKKDWGDLEFMGVKDGDLKRKGSSRHTQEQESDNGADEAVSSPHAAKKSRWRSVKHGVRKVKNKTIAGGHGFSAGSKAAFKQRSAKKGWAAAKTKSRDVYEDRQNSDALNDIVDGSNKSMDQWSKNRKKFFGSKEQKAHAKKLDGYYHGDAAAS